MVATKADIHSHTPASLRHDAEDEAQALSALVLAAQHAVENVMSGEHALRKPGAGERFWQFRDYDISDRPQDIDWRQSAKGDAVFVRQKERQSAQNVMFWASSDHSMDFRSSIHLPSKKSAAQVLTLATAILLTKGHETVQLLGGSFLPGRTEKTLQLFAEEIIAAKPAKLQDMNVQTIKKNSALFLVSDFLDEIKSIKNSLNGFAQNCKRGLLIQVLDPAEIDLPYHGRYIFEGMSDKETINNVGSIRSEYQERIESHIEELTSTVRQMGWDIILHRTDEDISRTLFKVWMRFATDDMAAGRNSR